MVKALGIIGARSGSKGVPDKNIRALGGKPLLAWIIETAKKARALDRVIVSTDSEQYAQAAKAYGAEVPFLRPAALAEDHSQDMEYIEHALQWLRQQEGYEPEIVVRLVPTAPLQLPQDIDAAVKTLLDDPQAHSAMVVAQARQHPEKALKIVRDDQGREYLENYTASEGKSFEVGPRQAYAPAYFRANIIASRVATLQTYGNLFGEKVAYHAIPQERAIDIDSELDFLLAEHLLKKLAQE